MEASHFRVSILRHCLFNGCLCCVFNRQGLRYGLPCRNLSVHEVVAASVKIWFCDSDAWCRPLIAIAFYSLRCYGVGSRLSLVCMQLSQLVSPSSLNRVGHGVFRSSLYRYYILRLRLLL